MKKDSITLDKLNDKQKSLLAQLAFIDIDLKKYKNYKEKITIRNLNEFLLNANISYLGKVTEKLTGIETTSLELIDEIKDNGLENLEIIGLFNHEINGFSAIAFKDKKENIGITFRGTDTANKQSFISDSLTDISEYITNNNDQIKEAIKFYNKYANKNGCNYLYGHSLGGNLVEHVLLNNYFNIASAFVINPEHISQELLDSEEKITAFNDKKKFSCYVIGGDWVSELKDSTLYKDNINYVKNNSNLKRNILSEHAIETATFDKNNNFVVISKEEAFKNHKHIIQRFFINTVMTIGKIVKRLYKFIIKILN